VDKNWKLTAKNATVDVMQFVRNAGTVTGLNVGFTVNYGKTSMPVQADVWDELTEQQKALAQGIYDRLLAIGADIVNESQ